MRGFSRPQGRRTSSGVASVLQGAGGDSTGERGPRGRSAGAGARADDHGPGWVWEAGTHPVEGIALDGDPAHPAGCHGFPADRCGHPALPARGVERPFAARRGTEPGPRASAADRAAPRQGRRGLLAGPRGGGRRDPQGAPAPERARSEAALGRPGGAALPDERSTGTPARKPWSFATMASCAPGTGDRPAGSRARTQTRRARRPARRSWRGKHGILPPRLRPALEEGLGPSVIAPVGPLTLRRTQPAARPWGSAARRGWRGAVERRSVRNHARGSRAARHEGRGPRGQRARDPHGPRARPRGAGRRGPAARARAVRLSPLDLLLEPGFVAENLRLLREEIAPSVRRARRARRTGFAPGAGVGAPQGFLLGRPPAHQVPSTCVLGRVCVPRSPA